MRENIQNVSSGRVELPGQYALRLSVLAKAAVAFSRSMYQSIILIDCVRGGFLYVSGNFDFLCGLPADEVQRRGFSFYRTCIVPEDLEMLRNLGTAWKELTRQFSVEEWTDFSCHCDARIQNGRNVHLMHHTFTLLDADEESRPRLVLCAMSMSSANGAGHIRMRRSTDDIYYEYNAKSLSWEKRRCVPLKDMERRLLFLAGQGLTVAEIARELCKSVDAVKTCKQKLFKRLGARNTAEAVAYAINYQLL